MNKIIVSIVFAIILVLGINKVTDVIFYVEKPEKSAYQVTSLTTAASTTSAETSSTNSEEGNIMALFASTSTAEGAKVFKKCAACHSIKEGGANKIGPALWGVLGMIIAIPFYTLFRVIAKEFLSEFKLVQELTKNI